MNTSKTLSTSLAHPSSAPIGGGRPYLFSYLSITSFIKKGNDKVSTDHVFHYVDHVDELGCLKYSTEQGLVYVDLPLCDIVPHILKQMIKKIAQIHKISLGSSSHLPKDQLIKAFDGHDCVNCNFYTSQMHLQTSQKSKKFSTTKKKISHSLNQVKGTSLPTAFPPSPLTEELSETIVRDWCKATHPSQLEESGCA
ncbi:hypothetical protein L208DRAFT_1244225, partial [Tricholoma matsutake]